MTRTKLSMRAADSATAVPARPSAERLARLKDRARALRREPTEAETVLWTQLSGARLGGIKFSRKTVVGTAIVDFACPSRWLVIGISQPGGNAEVEALQDRLLAETGVRVLRYTAEDVTGQLDRVVGEIVEAVNQPFDRRAALRASAARGWTV